jgi:hypothetical protein
MPKTHKIGDKLTSEELHLSNFHIAVKAYNSITSFKFVPVQKKFFINRHSRCYAEITKIDGDTLYVELFNF